MPRTNLSALVPSSLEVRVALRRLAARPLATCAVFLSLTLGLALVSLVVSVADRLLLRPLPLVTQSDLLVAIERTTQDPRGGNTTLSWLDFEELSDAVRDAGTDIAAFYPTRLGLASSLDGGSELGTRRIDAVVHSDRYGETLGVVPLLGRWPRDQADENDGVGLEVALSYRLWTELGQPADVLGSSLRLQGRSTLVVGVLPDGFVGTDLSHQPQVWIPISTFEHLATGIDGQFAAQRDDKAWLQVIGRFGSSRPDLGGRLHSLRDELARTRPDAWKDRGLAAVPLVQRAFGGVERREALERHLSLLLAALGGAFVVAYANCAGLVAIRTADRLAEWRLRTALGAGRGRLVAAASLEGLLLGVGALVAAPVCGVLLWPLVHRLRLPDDAMVNVAFDARQFVPVLLLGGLGALALAATPALTLAVRRRRPGPRSGPQARQLLVAGQVALAFVALGAAFQLMQTVDAYRQVDAGVSSDATERLLAVGLDVGAAGHDGADALDAFHQIDGRLRAVAGVEGASLASTLPILDSGPMVNLTIQAEGADPPPSGEHHAALHALVGSRFFTTVGRSVVEGRDFAPGDDAAARPVLIVNRALAERLWGDRTALGREISLVAAKEPYTVVGVVEDGRYAGLREAAQPTLYMAHSQAGRSMIATSLATSATVLVRLRGKSSPALLRDVRAAVAAVDPAVPVLWIRPLQGVIEDHYAIERQVASILVAVASALLLFCLLGIYGGLAHSFVHQRGELAVRTALGATRCHLMSRLAAPTGRSLLLGLLAGVWMVAPTSALLDRLLFGVEAGSPTSWLAAAGVLLGAVLLAGVDPVRGVLTLETAAMLRDE